MGVTMYAILGFTMMLILTAVLVSGKFTPSIPMIVIPIILRQLCTRHFEDLSSWVTTGLKRTGQQCGYVYICDHILWCYGWMPVCLTRSVGKMMLGS